MPQNEQATPRNVMPGRVKIARSARNDWFVTVEQGVTREELKRPEFWSLVGKQFKPYDRIDVGCDDGSFFAEYIVITADRAWAKVQELRFIQIGTQDVSLTEAHAADIRRRYEVKWRGPHLKHCVERKDGDKVERLKEGCLDAAEATLWLEEHLKAVA